MYIRKEIRDFMNKMPKEMKLPKHWKKFVREHDINYNLIIKHGNEYECTNCGKYFYGKHIHEEQCWEICPFCGGKYNVKRSNLKHYLFLYDLAILDNVENKLIVRYFEIEREYNKETRRFKDDIVEYARIVPELDIELANDRFIKYMFSEKIYHTRRIKKWRVFTGMYGLNQYYKSIYLENIDEKLKGTIYQYAPLKEALLYLKDYKPDFLYVLSKARYPSFELLMKAGLYELAITCSEKFNKPGSFEKRFGVNKRFYKFMKRHNITYEELQVLKLTNRPNIKIIRDILKMSDNNIIELEKAHKYIDLIKLVEYSKHQRNCSLHRYLDYIRNMERLEVPLTKKILLPENFIEAHDTSVKRVKAIVKNKDLLNERIKKRFKQLEENGYKDNTFFIRPAKSLNDMKNEARQQNNCVYTNYSEPYAMGDTDIYFLREIKNPSKSLITIEVKEKKIRQKERKNHRDILPEENEILKYWEKNIISKAA